MPPVSNTVQYNLATYKSEDVELKMLYICNKADVLYLQAYSLHAAAYCMLLCGVAYHRWLVVGHSCGLGYFAVVDVGCNKMLSSTILHLLTFLQNCV